MSVSGLFMYGLLFIALYFEVFLLIGYLRRRAVTFVPSHIDEADLPTVAIIVPCYNEEKTLRTTVESLTRLDYPTEKLEIIVVDDGSTDKTAEIGHSLEGGNVRFFSKPNGGKHSAMNYALARTNAELVGCLDADSEVASDALRNIVPLFLQTQVAAVTPGIHVRRPETVLQHMQDVEYQLSVFNRYMMAALGSVFITPGPFSIFRSSIVRELGGWRYAHSTEDMEMALRMQNAGHLIANAPKAVVHTATPRNFPALFRQRVRWTYGWLRNAVDYRHMLGNRAFGNLGIIILPTALISIFTAIFFFVRIVLNAISVIYHQFLKITLSGVMPHPHFELFYINTSAMLFLVYASVVIILILIIVGSLIGTGSRKPPAATPLFLLFYSFLVPLWLSAAVFRATFKTGVKWKVER